ncbi:uncharacterized protein Z520_11664 [Fonsecaea multimorphosa CBS 102226]|uniref:Uncharacterized protein n=1 Tax=Fonsecaea multimorphosa CBS 102226 TaxID=1442371 RepID=A0A0D2GT30_9EURO|nr:uncharacterized protein Z520_11664 [Fonsecaea multimorphosa CBS 102226]KIX92635.1 hypothetical protein Z520_11664 [Fonsecaea multimorphosa CBS 102226]OAL17858.1 hypothetical protein AYO22_11202 [Fonsecaea multimorphosa]
MPAKVALITGSSAGLGAAIVKALSRDYRIVVNYHSDLSKAQKVVEGCTRAPEEDGTSILPRSHIVKADISVRSDIIKLVEEVMTVMGRLDVVVSNVGWTRIVKFSDLEQNMNDEDWDRCFSINVKSHLWLFHATRPHLQANSDGGSFLVVSSLAGVIPSGSSIPYSVSKAAAIHLSKCLASVSGPKVRCNSLSPGLMMTDWGQQFPEHVVESVRDKTILKRVVDLDDVANLAKTIVLNGSLTGQNFTIDCGIAL